MNEVSVYKRVLAARRKVASGMKAEVYMELVHDVLIEALPWLRHKPNAPDDDAVRLVLVRVKQRHVDQIRKWGVRTRCHPVTRYWDFDATAGQRPQLDAA